MMNRFKEALGNVQQFTPNSAQHDSNSKINNGIHQSVYTSTPKSASLLNLDNATKLISDNFSLIGAKSLRFLKSNLVNNSANISSEQDNTCVPQTKVNSTRPSVCDSSSTARLVNKPPEGKLSNKKTYANLLSNTSSLNLDEYRAKLSQIREANSVRSITAKNTLSNQPSTSILHSESSPDNSNCPLKATVSESSSCDNQRLQPSTNEPPKEDTSNRNQICAEVSSDPSKSHCAVTGLEINTLSSPSVEQSASNSSACSVASHTDANTAPTPVNASIKNNLFDSIPLVSDLSSHAFHDNQANFRSLPNSDSIELNRVASKYTCTPLTVIFSTQSGSNSQKCSKIPARPTCFVRSLSSNSGSSLCDTPTPRSPMNQAHYLCPTASTKLTEQKYTSPTLTLSDILLEVRTNSIEKILVSLMEKISTFVNSRDKPIRNDKQLRAIVRIGQSVNFAVERFAAVGEAIADDNPEIRTEMYDACKDARAAGSLIEQLCSLTAPSLRGHDSSTLNSEAALFDDVHASSNEGSVRAYADRTAMSRAARALLSSVTRVLLVADTVVVKQIVSSKDRVSMTLNRLENVANFTEFVKAFSHFGMEMVELAHLTSDRQNDLKSEKRRAQMAAARRTLERSTMMLLTTSKACLRHPDCQSARENRDTVFAQMRRAMDLIHFVVKEGIIMNQAKSSSTGTMPVTSSSPHHFHRPNSSSSSSSLHLPFDPHNEALLYGREYSQRPQRSRETCIPKYQRRGQLHRAQRSVPGGSFVLAVESTLRWLHEQLDTCPTIVNFLRRIQELLDLVRMGSVTGPVKEQIVFSLEAAIERTQDFTDSAYTSHEHREKILMLCDQTKAELNALFRNACMSDQVDASPTEDLESSIIQMFKLTNELKRELQEVALDQAEELFRLHLSLDLPLLLKNSALDCDHEQVDELIEQFREHTDHVQEVCRLLFHVAPSAALQVTAGHTETSIEIHCEQMLTALNTLVLYPSSKIVKENYEVFADVWSNLIGDISQIMRDVGDYLRNVMVRDHLQRPSPVSNSVPPSMAPPSMPQAPINVMGSPSIATAPILPGATVGAGYRLPENEPVPMTADTAGDLYGLGVPMAPPAVATIPNIVNASVAPNESNVATGATNTTNTTGTRPTSVQINPEVDVVEIGSGDKWNSQATDLDDNDIVRKAKSMSAMAMAMFQFTRGEGELKTTQDLFTQAEFFADEANKLYKIVRHFTYQIPAGAPKKELLDCIDQVPTYVQQLQFAVKNVTVGKTATFTKVDNVIQETKNLMSVITRVVTACMNCANKYNLDMQGALRTRSRTLSPSYRAETEMFFEGGAMSKGGVASSDPDI